MRGNRGSVCWEVRDMCGCDRESIEGHGSGMVGRVY